jgi:transcriptional regulator with XRE-family HTH domain
MENNQNKNKGGRPRKYETNVVPYLDRIPKMKKQGMNDEQIADKLGISHSSLMEYKKKFPEFSEAFKTGKMELIEELEDTLYRKALGKIKVKKVKRYIEDINGVKKQKIEETEEEIPPDTASLVFSLKNLDPLRWKDSRFYEGDTLNHKNELSEDINKLIDTLKDKGGEPSEN